MAGLEPCELKCKTCLLKLGTLQTTVLTLTQQLSAASTKSYMKAIYLLFASLSPLLRASRPEGNGAKWFGKSAVSSGKAR